MLSKTGLSEACAHRDIIKMFPFSIAISISVSVYSAQSTIESLQLSKLQSLLETQYIELKKKFLPTRDIIARGEARRARETPLIHDSDSCHDIMLYSELI